MQTFKSRIRQIVKRRIWIVRGTECPCHRLYHETCVMLTWGFGFWMWRQTLARGVLWLLSAKYSVVMCGASPGTLVTWPWLRLSMIYCCVLRLWSQICVTCRSCWFPVLVALSCCVGARCIGPVGWRDGYGAFRQPKFECGCCEILFFRVCGVRQNLYVYSLYHNPDLDEQIFDCLLASMAAVRAG